MYLRSLRLDMPKQFVQLSLVAAADLLVLQKFQNRPHQYGRDMESDRKQKRTCEKIVKSPDQKNS